MALRSFDDVLNTNKGIGPGFDLLRLGLALAILLSHTSGISGNRGFLSATLASIFGISAEMASYLGPASSHGNLIPSDRPVTGLARPYTLALVPMFFALSGFLVTGSAFRSRKIANFLGLRVLRILPALIVEVTLSALIIGVIFTTLPLNEYFSSPEFFRYFGNIVGHVSYTLPGVFQDTSFSTNVNSNLWTLPFEFYCYLLLAAIMFLSVLYNRVLFTIIFGIATAILIISNSFFEFHVTNGTIPGFAVVYYFFAGVLFFLWREKVIYRFSVFLVCGILSYILMFSNKTVYIYPLLLTYMTIFIGMTNFPKIQFLRNGDYSYGIYLYGYPTIQSVIAAFPFLKGNLLALCVVSIGLTFGFSYLSWHLIEKHFLKLKKYLSPRSAQITEVMHASGSSKSHAGDATKRSVAP